MTRLEIKSILIPALLLLFAAAHTPAQVLKLIPEPKQVEKRKGEFVINPKTRIVINAARSEEDRTGAEMLAEEIEAATGYKIRIVTARRAPKYNTIYLARAGDDKRL